MAFLIDTAFLPATLTAPRMTDDQFAEFCAEHPDLSFEVTAEGSLIVSPPNYSLTGSRNNEIAMQLGIWAKQDKRGVANDSSAGYVLPSGARSSPDASWVRKNEDPPAQANARRLKRECTTHEEAASGKGTKELRRHTTILVTSPIAGV